MNPRIRRTGIVALVAGAFLAAGGSVYASNAEFTTATGGQPQAQADKGEVSEAKVESGLTEELGRGLISVPSNDGNFVSWRLHADDPEGIAFNLYRDGTKLNSSPITGSTNYFDEAGGSKASYTVRPVLDGVEQRAQAATEAVPFQGEYQDVPIEPPPGGTTPSGEEYTYTANDASVGDLDGDGEYEIVLKWYPTNAKDNAQSGYTGNVFVDAYKLDGTQLWRIDLGVNIRAGAHYTQFQVFDYDGDGSAEVAMKTADGTVDGEGAVIGDGSADYRNGDGYILDGPEFLSIFNGQTGAAMDTVDYVPERGNVADWGDDYGNRVDRFLAGTAYLDGSTPSMIFSRGYYTRSVIAAWNWDGSSLSNVWTFDSNEAGSEYEGQGMHSLSIADADGDGNDEVMFGAMAIDDDGSPLWNTQTYHGDAYHVSDLDPGRDGLEVFKVSESGDQPSSMMIAAESGEILWNTDPAEDNGRGVSADIWADNDGAESWSSNVDGLLNTAGENVGNKPGSTNFVVWWDGDAQRELLDDTHIDKYGPDGDTRLLDGEDVASNNGTKATPALSADILGDWREEVIWRTSDSSALRIYSTTDSTDISHPSLMEDRQYRVAVAWQNTAYNQPPHASFLTP